MSDKIITVRIYQDVSCGNRHSLPELHQCQKMMAHNSARKCVLYSKVPSEAMTVVGFCGLVPFRPEM